MNLSVYLLRKKKKTWAIINQEDAQARQLQGSIRQRNAKLKKGR